MALRGADLDVFEGELLMIVGPSGSGKTTLVSVITAILAQDSGRCEVFGRDLSQMTQRERARFRASSIGFVFQMFHLLPALTSTENVAVPLLIGGVPRREAESRAVRALEQVGLAARAESLPPQLSGGEQQRVAIARALIHEPGLLVCDEPTSALDHATGQGILETLQHVAKRPNRAVIVVTHDSRIYSFADRIARMDDGRILDIVSGEDRANLR